MSERNTDPDSEAADGPATAPHRQPADGNISPCHQAYLERNDDRPDVCTIYSSVTSGTVEEIWIRAVGSAFVSRDDAR